MKSKLYKSRKLLRSYVIYKTIERNERKIIAKEWGLNDFDVRLDQVFPIICKAFYFSIFIIYFLNFTTILFLSLVVQVSLSKYLYLFW